MQIFIFQNFLILMKQNYVLLKRMFRDKYGEMIAEISQNGLQKYR